jgi:hypothetical protein
VHCIVNFPSTWIDASKFEAALTASCGPHASSTYTVAFNFPAGCKIMVDVGIRLLSLANQLASTSRRVRLSFDEGEAGTMGYLNRMGFFDHLHEDVEVDPARPMHSVARLRRGSNSMLVEIARINKDARDTNLPSRLTQAVIAGMIFLDILEKRSSLDNVSQLVKSASTKFHRTMETWKTRSLDAPIAGTDRPLLDLITTENLPWH